MQAGQGSCLPRHSNQICNNTHKHTHKHMHKILIRIDGTHAMAFRISASGYFNIISKGILCWAQQQLWVGTAARGGARVQFEVPLCHLARIRMCFGQMLSQLKRLRELCVKKRGRVGAIKQAVFLIAFAHFRNVFYIAFKLTSREAFVFHLLQHKPCPCHSRSHSATSSTRELCFYVWRKNPLCRDIRARP